MDTTKQKKLTPETITDKEQFWKKHARLQKESGLSRIAYCRKHQLNNDQFSYWQRKWRQEKASSRLLPVHLTQMPVTTSPEKLEPLCTIEFKNGHELKIHNQAVLPMLLSLLG